MTVDPASQDSSRVFYPPGNSNCAPVLRFAYEIVLGENISPRTLLGFFRVSARYEVRGRRGIPLAPAQLYDMLSTEQKALLHTHIAETRGDKSL